MALTELTIRNFAIIKQLEIEIDNGLTVVTGETGAGKSVVLGALNLVKNNVRLPRFFPSEG